jgi:hypothetical protein
MTLTHAELVERWKKFVESKPNIDDDLSVLKVYEDALEKARKQGLDASLIVPKHCTRCGLGLRESKFLLKIKCSDQTTPLRIKLDTPFDIELIALSLQGTDRLCEIGEVRLGDVFLKDWPLFKQLHVLFGMHDKNVEFSSDLYTDDEQAVLLRPISDLRLSTRSKKCMSRLGIKTIGELTLHTADELLECRNFGVTGLREIKDKLSALNLKLREDSFVAVH